MPPREKLVMNFTSELRQFEQNMLSQESDRQRRRAARLRDPEVRKWLEAVQDAARSFRSRWSTMDLGFADRVALRRLHDAGRTLRAGAGRGQPC